MINYVDLSQQKIPHFDKHSSSIGRMVS